MELTQDQLDKLQSLVTGEPSDWKEDTKFRRENKKWLQYSQSIAFEILRELRLQGLSQKDLAIKIGVSPQQVNKWLKGFENFTIETISKLEDALGINLIKIQDESSEVNKAVSTNLMLTKFLSTSERGAYVDGKVTEAKVVSLHDFRSFKEELRAVYD